MKQLFIFLKPYKAQLILGPAFKLIEAILELMLPFLMAKIIDIGVSGNNKNYIIKTGVIMLLITLVGVFCAIICQYTASIVSQGVGTNIRNAIFEHIGKFSHAEIDKFGTASLTNRIINDVNQIQLAVAMLIRLVIRAPFLCIGGLVMATLIDVKLSIIMFIVLPIFIFLLVFTMKKTIPLYKNVQKKLDNISLIIRQNLSGVRVIRAFAKVEYEKSNFQKYNAEYADNAIAVNKISAFLNPLTTFIMNTAIITILWFGGIRVNAGNILAGSVFAYINYVNQILASLIIISQLVVLYTKAFASATRIVEIFDTTCSIRVNNPKKVWESEDVEYLIEFSNVSMKYENSRDFAIKDISFKVKKGEVVGIIGGTGSGKTTLINMIPRFYDVDEGEVIINGINLKDAEPEELRSEIGIVLQKPVLFRGSIEENIRFGKLNATDEEVLLAAQISQSEEFIEKLPNKYKTLVNQGGVNVSGGQRQRLTIARAIIKRPKILILDDSMSALDFVTDFKVRQKIKENFIDTTTLIVSQRASSIMNSDKIIVLNEGSIAGIGKHEELLNTCEIYLEIWKSQNKEELKDSKMSEVLV